MNASVTLATARRVIIQLRHDPRTVALLLVVPTVLITLVKWIFDGQPQVFQRVGVPLVGVFPLTSMFLVTAMAMLRERTTGTLERLMTLPLAKLDLLAGYALAFAVMAFAQAALIAAVAFGLLGLEVEGSPWAILALAVLNAVLGSTMGLFVSAFANSEFQAAQFMPAIVLPQMLLSGLLAPRPAMARGLEIVSDYLPMTYAYDALHRVGTSSDVSGRLWLDVSVLLGVTVLAIAAGAATLPRRTE
jgi:ABC-2 type transport system permease protein